MDIFDTTRIGVGFFFPTFGWNAVYTAVSYELYTGSQNIVKHMSLYLFGFLIRAIILDTME
jgi:hypothetical protein